MNIKNLFKRNKQEKEDPRMYILVRSDLAPGLQMAQACHAASYLAAQNPLLLYQHPTTIVLGVDNEFQLNTYASLTNHTGFMFKEPDLDYQATAYAFYSEKEEFTNLSLALKDLAPLV